MERASWIAQHGKARSRSCYSSLGIRSSWCSSLGPAAVFFRADSASRQRCGKTSTACTSGAGSLGLASSFIGRSSSSEIGVRRRVSPSGPPGRLGHCTSGFDFPRTQSVQLQALQNPGDQFACRIGVIRRFCRIAPVAESADSYTLHSKVVARAGRYKDWGARRLGVAGADRGRTVIQRAPKSADAGLRSALP